MDQPSHPGNLTSTLSDFIGNLTLQIRYSKYSFWFKPLQNKLYCPHMVLPGYEIFSSKIMTRNMLPKNCAKRHIQPLYVNFGGGGHFYCFWFGSECGTARLNLSLFFLFSCATADIVIDVDGLDNILPSWSSSTSTSMTMIFSTNQRPTIEVT